MVSQIVAWPPEAMAVIDDLSRKCLFQRKLLIQISDKHVAERELFVEKFRQYREQVEEYIKKLQTSYAETLIDLISNRENILTQLQCTDDNNIQKKQVPEKQPSILLQDDHQAAQSGSYRQLLTRLRDELEPSSSRDGDPSSSVDFIGSLALQQHLDTPLSKLQEQFVASLLQQEFNDQVRCLAEEYRLLLRESTERYEEVKLSLEQVQLALKAKECENSVLRTKVRKYVMMDGGLRKIGNEMVNFNSIVSNALSNAPVRNSVNKEKKNTTRSHTTRRSVSSTVMGRPATVGSLRFSDPDVVLSHVATQAEELENNHMEGVLTKPTGPKPEHYFQRVRHRKLAAQLDGSDHVVTPLVPVNSVTADSTFSSTAPFDTQAGLRKSVQHNTLCSLSNNDYSQTNETVIRCTLSDAHSGIMLEDLQSLTDTERNITSLRLATVAVGDEVPYHSISVTITHDFEIRGEKVVLATSDDPLLICPNPDLKSSMDSLHSLSTHPECNQPIFQSIGDSLKSILVRAESTSKTPKSHPVYSTADSYDANREADDKLTEFCTTQLSLADAKAQRLRMYHIMRNAADRQALVDKNVLSQSTNKLLKDLSAPPQLSIDVAKPSTYSVNNLQTGLLLQVDKCALNIENEAGDAETRIFYDKRIHTSILPFLMSTNVTHRRLIERLSLLEKRRKEHDSELVNSHTLMSAAIAERREAVLAKERLERQMLAISRERDILIQSYENRLNSLQFNLKDATERATTLYRECAELGANLQAEKERYLILEGKYDKLSATVREDVISEMKQIENATIGRLQADIVFYKDNLQLSEERIIELAKINTRLEQTNSELKVDVLKQTLHKDQLKQRLRDELIIEYGRRIRSLEEQINQSEERYNEKVKETGELIDAIYRLRSDLDFLTEENAHMHVSMHSLSTEMADIVQKHHTSESDRRALYVKYSALQQEATALKTERDLLATELATITATHEEQNAALQQVVDAYRAKYLLVLKRTSPSVKDTDSLCLMVEQVQNHANSVLAENAKELEELNGYASRLKEIQDEARQPSRCSYDSFSFSRDTRSASGLFSNKHVTINLDQPTEIKETPLSKKVFKSENLSGSDTEDVFQSIDGTTISDVSALCDKDLSICTDKQDASTHQALLQHRRRKSLTVNSGIVVTNQTIGLTYSGLKVESAAEASGVAVLGIAVQTETQRFLVNRGVTCHIKDSMETLGIQVALPLDSVLSDSDLLAEAYDQVEKLRIEKRMEASSHGAVMKTARARMQSLETELLSQVHTKETLAATVADLRQQLDAITQEFASYRQQHESDLAVALQASPSHTTPALSIATLEKLSQDMVSDINSKTVELLSKISLLDNRLSSVLKSRRTVIKTPATMSDSSQCQDLASPGPEGSISTIPLITKSTETDALSTVTYMSRGLQVNQYSVKANESGRKKMDGDNVVLSVPSGMADLQTDVQVSQPGTCYALFDSAVALHSAEHSDISHATSLSLDMEQQMFLTGNACALKGMEPPTNTLLSTITDTHEDDSTTATASHSHEQASIIKSPTTPASVRYLSRPSETSHALTYYTNEEQGISEDQPRTTFYAAPKSNQTLESSFAGSDKQHEAGYGHHLIINDPPCLLDSVLHTSAPQNNQSICSSSLTDSSVIQFSFETEDLFLQLATSEENSAEVRQRSIEEYYRANEAIFTHTLAKVNTDSHTHTESTVPAALCKAVLTTDIELNMLRLACNGHLILPKPHSYVSVEVEDLSPKALIGSLGIFEQEIVCKYCGAYKELDRYLPMDVERYAVAMQQSYDRRGHGAPALFEKPKYIDALEELETFSNEQEIGIEIKPSSTQPNQILLDRYAHYPLMTSSMLLKRYLHNENGGVPGKRLCIGQPVITTSKIEYIASLNAYALSHDYERERDKLSLEDYHCSFIRRAQLHQKILSTYDHNSKHLPTIGRTSNENLIYSDSLHPGSRLQTAVVIDALHQRLDELQRMNTILLFDNKALQVKLCEDEKMLSIIFGRSYNGNITSADILLGRPADTNGYTKEDFERYRLVLRETLHRRIRPKSAGSVPEMKSLMKRPTSAQSPSSFAGLRRGLSSRYGFSVTDSAIHTVEDLVEMGRPASLSSPVRDAMSFSHRIAPFSQYLAHPYSSVADHQLCGSPLDKEIPPIPTSKGSKLTIVSTLPAINREMVALDPPPIYEDGLISRVPHAFTRRPSPSRGCSTSIQNIPPIKPPTSYQTPKRSRSKPITSLSVYYRGISPSSGGPVDRHCRSYISLVD